MSFFLANNNCIEDKHDVKQIRRPKYQEKGATLEFLSRADVNIHYCFHNIRQGR